MRALLATVFSAGWANIWVATYARALACETLRAGWISSGGAVLVLYPEALLRDRYSEPGMRVAVGPGVSKIALPPRGVALAALPELWPEDGATWGQIADAVVALGHRDLPPVLAVDVPWP